MSDNNLSTYVGILLHVPLELQQHILAFSTISASPLKFIEYFDIIKFITGVPKIHLVLEQPGLIEFKVSYLDEFDLSFDLLSRDYLLLIDSIMNCFHESEIVSISANQESLLSSYGRLSNCTTGVPTQSFNFLQELFEDLNSKNTKTLEFTLVDPRDSTIFKTLANKFSLSSIKCHSFCLDTILSNISKLQTPLQSFRLIIDRKLSRDVLLQLPYLTDKLEIVYNYQYITPEILELLERFGDKATIKLNGKSRTLPLVQRTIELLNFTVNPGQLNYSPLSVAFVLFNTDYSGFNIDLLPEVLNRVEKSVFSI